MKPRLLLGQPRVRSAAFVFAVAAGDRAVALVLQATAGEVVR
jgi:hypothetical protein